ncbi:MAG: ABC transporter permease [Actinobacteria bacterium]|nr:ABC transporter permease [Actinomycetota bacterium]
MNRVFSIVKKDLTQIFRNRFIAVISILVIVVFAIIYNLLPSKVDEVFRMGFHLKVDEEAAEEYHLDVGKEDIERRLSEAGGEEAEGGLELTWADSLEELTNMVENGKVRAGVSIAVSGQEPKVVLYVSSKTPSEITEAGEAIAAEIGYALIGYALPADFRATVIGPDMAGQQIPMRDKLRVILLAFVFLLELYGLGNLLVEEVQRKTAEALLVTPVTLKDFVSAKAVTGILIAFSQGLLLALLLRAISVDTWLAIIVFLLLGAAMTVGLAFIMGAISTDFISMVMISLIPFIALMIPGIIVLYPGLNSPLIKAIPTYYLIEPLNGILNYQMQLSDYLSSLLYLALFTVAFFILGFVILKRKLV